MTATDPATGTAEPTSAPGAAGTTAAVSMAALLGLDAFVVDEEQPHIVIDSDRCAACESQPCVAACPAQLYVRDPAGRMTFDHAGCLECGTCQAVCAGGGIAVWTYPRGTYGVEYRQG